MFKKLSCLVLAAGLSYTVAQAQDFQFIFDNPLADTTTGSQVYTPGSSNIHDYVEMDNAIQNISNGSYTITWRFLTVDSNITSTSVESNTNQWFVSGICDNINCRGEFLPWFYGQAEQSNTVAAGGNMILQAHIYAPSSSHDTTQVFKVELSSPKQVDTAVFILTKDGTTGIHGINVSDKRVMLYPNPLPASQNLNLYIDGNLGVKEAEVFNILGQRLLSAPITGNSEVHTINTTSLTSGMYFVRLVDQSGRVVATRKFTKE